MSLLDVVSPDAAFRHAIHEQMPAPDAGLGSAGPPSGFVTLDQAVAAWETHTPECILIDEAAFDQNVDKLAAIINTAPEETFLFVVGHGREILDEKLVTEAFPKPVRLGYLLARWQFYRQLRARNRDVTITLGPWQFVPRRRQLYHTGTSGEVRLTDKETDLLEYLCQAEQALPRDEILASVWGYDDGIDTHTLETHITRLRRKLEPVTGADAPGNVFLVESGCYRINPLWRGA